jgi:phosphinothricin acetyltransferase
MEIRTRSATMADAAALADIYNQAVLRTTATFDTSLQSEEERAAWLAAHGGSHPVVVAVEDGGIVGWASLSRWSSRCAYDRTVELSVYVDEAARGRGVGRTLVTEILRRAAELGLHAVLVQVCTENEISLAMVRRFGFERAGVLREVGEKFGRLLDVEILELLL